MRAETLKTADADDFFARGFNELWASHLRKTVLRWVHRAKLRNEEVLRFHVAKGKFLLVFDSEGDGRWKVLETLQEAEFTACVESLGLRVETEFLHADWKWWHALGFKPPPLKVYDISGWHIQGPPEPEGPLERPFLVF